MYNKKSGKESLHVQFSEVKDDLLKRAGGRTLIRAKYRLLFVERISRQEQQQGESKDE